MARDMMSPTQSEVWPVVPPDDPLKWFERVLTPSLERIQQQLKDLETSVDQRFDALGKRVDTLEKHTDDRFADMQRHTDNRFAAIEKRIDDLQHTIESQIQLGNTALRNEMLARFEAVDRHIDDNLVALRQLLQTALTQTRRTLPPPERGGNHER